ncbi:ABC transporter substrate-binding protein [Chloroflexota bacterium]
MKKAIYFLLSFMIVVSLILTGLPGCGKGPPEEPVKIGFLAPFTGFADVTNPDMLRGVEFVLDEIGWEVAGRQIEVFVEDSGSDPSIAVDKARKLVEYDNVDVVLGPPVAHTSLAVSAYLGKKGVIHLPTSPEPEFMLEQSPLSFIQFGTQEGLSYPLGQYAYEIGYRKASLLTADYEEGYVFCGAFRDGFTEAGGVVIQEQLVDPYTEDIGPYILNIDKSSDVIAAWLVALGSLTYAQRVREYGLNMPLMFVVNLPIAQSVLPQLGDAALGMISTATYTSLIDTPENNRFVNKYREKHGEYPTCYTMEGYGAVSVYLEAVKITGGDTTPEKIAEALKIVEVDTPKGKITMTPERVGVNNVYIVEATKVDGRYAWKPLKTVRR